SGMGRYFTRQDIERRSPIQISDMFTAMAGVSVYQVGAFGHRVVMGGGVHGNCVPTFYVDGVRLAMASDGDIDSLLPAYEVAGIEVYRNDLEAPAEYRGSSGCGSIVIWTTGAMP
ncbi:MAG TPA: Plug domain-containing protein, partial [Gemmatimonadaceae bacterium]|nr:Plug domain-containing protein [Gemmatimonadaceae bacterium]